MFDLSIEGALARLRLARPEARNAIPVEGWDALAVSLGEVERSGAGLLVVSGAREAFCAGADLADFPALMADASAVAAFRLAMRRALDLLRDLPLPTIAVIEGPCFGAGVALAMACDIRIARPGACFAITPAKLGIGYPQEDVARLVALVGPGQAARLLLGAITIDAAGAIRIGLAESGEAEGELTEAILANSAQSLATLKRAIRLTEAGVAHDAEQDRRFDELFAGPELEARLARFRPGR